VELMPPVDSMDKLWTPWERTSVESKLRAAIVGSDATVKEGLERLVATTGADEVIVFTDAWDHAVRLDSYRRVGEIAREIQTKTVAEIAKRSSGSPVTAEGQLAGDENEAMAHFSLH
jgi:hypothetical protein